MKCLLLQYKFYMINISCLLPSHPLRGVFAVFIFKKVTASLYQYHKGFSVDDVFTALKVLTVNAL